MKLIVGLGNPGDRYAKTRHNVGFMALETYSGQQFKFDQRFKSAVSETTREGEKIIFAEPQTFMNSSGEAVRAIVDYYDISPENVLVIYDELALGFGTIRARTGGESAGHNGIKSMIQHLGDGFVRLRIGISNEFSDRHPTNKFVLSNFSKDEANQLPKIFSVTNQLIDTFIARELDSQTVNINEGKERNANQLSN